ncbi:MAG: hypothetical protein ACREJO_11975 [Phycisphaerales bacterium]
MKHPNRRPTALLAFLVAAVGLRALPVIAAQAQPAGPVATPPPAAPAPVPPPPPAPPPDPSPVIRPAPGEDREITLFLKDGRQVRGELVEKDPTRFIIKIAGINSTYTTEEVDRFTILPSLLERYRDLRRTINENDVEQMLKLTVWLEEKNQIDLALAELVGLRKRFPDNPVVLRELNRVQRVADLQNRAPAPKPAPGAPVVPEPVVGPNADAVPRLNDSQINLIKVYEVDLTRPPQITVPRETMVAVLDKYAGSPLIPPSREARDALLRQSAEKKLDLLFRLKAREFYPQVSIKDSPETIRQFRQDVFQSMILNGCATSQCHGGTEAGRLVLATRSPNSDPTIYTNFLILDRFRLADGTPLINVDKPEMSPLLQMALPREDAVIRHPPVPGGELKKDQWRPTLRNQQERRFQDTIAWIRSLYKPRPDYDLGYTPLKPLVPPQPVLDPAPVR